MKEFCHWFDEQGQTTEEVDDVFNIQCGHCGKTAYLSLAAYNNGDTGWWTDEQFVFPGVAIWGLCGGGPGCTP